jgi:uncharacterized protein (TIGR03905 family)
MRTVFYTTGTCSSAIEIELDENGIIKDAVFIGGCNGNTQGISSLVKGQKAEEVIQRLEGIRCGMRPTSCPDQLAQALRKILETK